MAKYKPKTKARNSYSFLTDTIDYQSVIVKGKKMRYVTGYISTADIDLYNDIVTPKALKSMLNQINNSTIMLDYEHEAWRDDSSIIPVGKIVEAKIDDRGLWVKAELNPYSPKFENMWGSIKDGFIKAFSIAFKPLKTVMKTIGETEVRLIEELELLNVALTGCPVNQSASVTSYKGMKSVMLKAITDFEKEESKMEKKDEEAQPEATPEAAKEETPEQPAEEPKKEPEKEAQPEAEAPAEEAPEEPAKEEAPAEEKAKEESIKKLTEEMKALTKKLDAQAKEMKTLKESPVFKSLAPEQPETNAEPEVKSVLSAIR